MAWTADINYATPWPPGDPLNQPAGLAAYKLITVWEAAGLVCRGSGDGLLAHDGSGRGAIGNGQYLFGGIVGSIANPNAWVLFEHPGGAQQLIQCFSNIAPGNYLSAWSPSGAFAGGGAAVRPVAADEVRFDYVAAMGNVGHFSALGAISHYFYRTSAIGGIIPWHILQVNDATGTALAAYGVHGLLDCAATEAAPYITFQMAGAAWKPDSLPRQMLLHDPGGAALWAPASPGMLGVNGTNMIPIGGLSLDNPDDGLPRAPVVEWYYKNVADSYWKGRSEFAWSPLQGGLGGDYNRIWIDQDGNRYLHMVEGGGSEGLLFPGWPDSVTCPLPDLGGGIVTKDFVARGAIPTPDTTPPVLTVVSPTPGGSIRADDPFVIDVTDDLGLGLIVLTVELPAGGAHEVVWLRDAFAQAYSASTRAVVAGGYRFTVRRTGGWNRSPRFHVEAIDLGGNYGA